MPIMRATPYLFLNGQTREAVALYEAALGAKVMSLRTFGEAMSSCPRATKDRVMHAELLVDRAVLLLSDGPEDMKGEGTSQVQVALDFDDPAQMDERFEALAKGGEVMHPIHDTPYGGKLGTLRDAFGIGWMFHHTPKP